MKRSTVALLSLPFFASVDAFGISSIANRPLPRRAPKLLVGSFDTETTTKSILWEVIAFDNEMEQQNDHPMTRSELKRLRVLLEKRVNLGAAVLNGIRSRVGAEIYEDARRKFRVEETMDKTNDFKVFGFMQQVLSPKTTGGADLSRESDTNLSSESDTKDAEKELTAEWQDFFAKHKIDVRQMAAENKLLYVDYRELATSSPTHKTSG